MYGQIRDASKASLHHRIDWDFQYHSCNDDQQNRMKDIRQYAANLAHTMVSHCPHSRELSTAITLLEQVVTTANSAIAREGRPDENPQNPT